MSQIWWSDYTTPTTTPGDTWGWPATAWRLVTIAWPIRPDSRKATESLLHRFANVLHIWTLFLLLITFLHEWSRLVTFCNELLYIISFHLFTVSMTIFDAN
jgi:hypothetical protein